MASLQTNLENLRLGNYTSLVIITAIIYDYILTLSSEIEYIWLKPWSLVSTLFVLVRYLGICGFVIASFMGTSFLPGPEKFCSVLEIITIWAFFVYVCAADLAMILRIWAMYSRSKIILGVLLTSYLGEAVLSTIASIIHSNPKSFVMIVNQILDLSFCSLRPISGSWYKVNNLSQLVHAGVMCTLVIVQFTIRSVEMYRATKRWEIGPFISLLVMEGMAYFFAIFFWVLISTLYDFETLHVVGSLGLPLFVVQCVPVSTLTPRFILSVREMCARSVYVGKGNGIDTGFGLTALSGHGVTRSTIVFVDGEEREGLEYDGEDTEMERMV